MNILRSTRRQFLNTLGLGATSLFSAPLLCPAAAPAAQRKPNVLFILIDDMGWRDCGCNGSDFYETPHIDRLASEGTRFTAAYAAAAVCSPTRAALMSGKYPARLKITDWIPGNPKKGKLDRLDFEQQLPLSEFTLAEAFKANGYQTGFIGKWHLGDEPYFPDKQGFDSNLAGHHRGGPHKGYFSPWDLGNLPNGPEGQYLPDRLGDAAVQFIRDNRDRPFFLLLSHYTVHSPVQAKQETIEKYRRKAEALPEGEKPEFVAEGPDALNREIQNHPAFAAMIEHMDDNVGKVLAALKELGLEKDTVVVFTSDNGGQSILPGPRGRAWGSNRPLRAGKGWLYEGGIRIPLIIRWPGVLKGGSLFTSPVITMDLYPTLLSMTGAPSRPEQHQDGLDLTDALRGKTTLKRDTLYWHYPHYHGSAHRPSGAIRWGDYKLIEFFEDMRVELYHLGHDPGETNNLAGQAPEITDRLRQMLHQWRRDVDASMPVPNPKDPIAKATAPPLRSSSNQ